MKEVTKKEVIERQVTEREIITLPSGVKYTVNRPGKGETFQQIRARWKIDATKIRKLSAEAGEAHAIKDAEQREAAIEALENWPKSNKIRVPNPPQGKVSWSGKCATKTGRLVKYEDYTPEFTIVIGEGRLIAGMEEVLLGMREGEHRSVEIPPRLGYGEDHTKANARPQAVPVNSTLYLEIDLQEIYYIADPNNES